MFTIPYVPPQCPGIFPGISRDGWREHYRRSELLDCAEAQQRTAWVGQIPPHLATEERLRSKLEHFGEIEAATVYAKGGGQLQELAALAGPRMGAGTGGNSAANGGRNRIATALGGGNPKVPQAAAAGKRKHEKSWALITFAKQPGTAAEESELVSAQVSAASASVICECGRVDCAESVHTKGHRSVLTVLPADEAVVGKEILEQESVHSAVRLWMAIAAWFLVLLVAGPAMTRSWHSESWSYEESVYFVFCTMSTIGFGDFYPNERATKYAETATAGDHPVQIYCEGVFVISCSLGVFSFVYATLSDWWQERKEANLMDDNDSDDDDDVLDSDDDIRDGEGLGA